MLPTAQSRKGVSLFNRALSGRRQSLSEQAKAKTAGALIIPLKALELILFAVPSLVVVKFAVFSSMV